MHFLRTAVLALTTASVAVNANTPRRHQQRSLIDVCANVDGDLAILGIVFGRLDLCLCVSAIPVFLETNLVLQAAVLLLGKSTVTSAVSALIKGAADHKQCIFPDHAVPQCSANPCNFYCKDGFTASPAKNPTACVCEPPNTVCNGVCGYFPSCASQKVKRDASWRDATCPHGWSACPIWGRERLAYECVDVSMDLWSCGGCGLPMLSSDPTGVDCTAIPGVHDVACVSGRCDVQRCKGGFEVSSDGTTCVSMTRIRPHNPHPVLLDNGEAPFKG